MCHVVVLDSANCSPTLCALYKFVYLFKFIYKCTCQMVSKFVTQFRQDARLRQKTEEQTKKCVAIASRSNST